MSIVVALDDLADEVATRGPGYLLTTGSIRPHVMHLRFSIDGSTLRAPIGRSASANIAAHPAVTVVWPPTEDGGYSLIVDGDATTATDADGGVTATIVATGAVLHRPA